MSEATVGLTAARPVSANGSRPRWIAIGRDGLRDAVSGTVAAVVQARYRAAACPARVVSLVPPHALRLRPHGRCRMSTS